MIIYLSGHSSPKPLEFRGDCKSSAPENQASPAHNQPLSILATLPVGARLQRILYVIDSLAPYHLSYSHPSKTTCSERFSEIVLQATTWRHLQHCLSSRGRELVLIKSRAPSLFLSLVHTLYISPDARACSIETQRPKPTTLTPEPPLPTTRRRKPVSPRTASRPSRDPARTPASSSPPAVRTWAPLPWPENKRRCGR